jgi:hypothetical protein
MAGGRRALMFEGGVKWKRDDQDEQDVFRNYPYPVPSCKSCQSFISNKLKAGQGLKARRMKGWGERVRRPEAQVCRKIHRVTVSKADSTARLCSATFRAWRLVGSITWGFTPGCHIAGLQPFIL